MSTDTVTTEFAFAFDPAYVLPAWFFGIRDETSAVRVSADWITASFGAWTVRTRLDNITSVALEGPYRFLKTAGPAHLSVKDGGLTFASNAHRGVCLQFRTPVSGIDPFGWIRHRNLTLTVDRPEDLAELLAPHARDRGHSTDGHYD